MAAAGIAFVLVALLALGGPLVLYWLVEAERDRDAANTADFETAEQAARRDQE